MTDHALSRAVLPELRTGGRFAFNVMQFCRLLRAAGLPIGPGRTLAAIEATMNSVVFQAK